MWISFMFVVAVAAVLGGVGYLYFSGRRSRDQQVADRTAAARGHKQEAHGATRTEGRGDL